MGTALLIKVIHLLSVKCQVLCDFTSYEHAHDEPGGWVSKISHAIKLNMHMSVRRRFIILSQALRRAGQVRFSRVMFSLALPSCISNQRHAGELHFI